MMLSGRRIRNGRDRKERKKRKRSRKFVDIGGSFPQSLLFHLISDSQILR
jgi:hypothetical protein